MEQLFYWRVGQTEISTSLGGTNFVWPELTQSDKVLIGLRPSQFIGSRHAEVSREVTGVRASLGRVDARPLSGTVAFYIDEESITVVPDSGTDDFSAVAHGLSDGQRVQVQSSVDDLPAGLVADFTYFVVAAAADSFQLAKTAGGTAIDLADAGSGVITVRQISDSIEVGSTAAQVQEAFDTLNYVGNGLAYESPVVTEESGSYLLEFPCSESEVPIKIANNFLRPISFARVRANRQSAVWTHEIRMVQAPVAFTSTFTNELPQPPEIVTFKEGGTTVDTTGGVKLISEVQQLNLNPLFRGAYEIRWKGRRTKLLDRSDGPEEVQEALKELADDGGEFIVTSPQSNVGHISFEGEMKGVNQDLMTVQVMSTPPADQWVELDLATWVAASILRDLSANGESVELVFELEVTYENPNDSNRSVIWTYAADVRLVPELIWEGLESLPSIDWLRPHDPTSYSRFTPDQISTGNASATVNFGADLEETFTHGLDSPNVIVQVHEIGTGGKQLVHGVDYTVVFDDNNSLTVTLIGVYDPAPGVGTLAMNVLAMGETSAFDPHTHTTDQIVGLDDLLSNVYERLDLVENLAGVQGIVVKGSESVRLSRFPIEPFFEVFPSRFEDGEYPEVPGKLMELHGIELPRRGGLLPAVHDAAVDDLSTILVSGDLPDPAGYSGSVYVHDGADEIYVAQRLQRRSEYLQPGEFVTSDGSIWYRVTPYARQAAVTFSTDFAQGDVFTSPGHKLIEGNRVQFTTTGTLPSPLTAATDYWVSLYANDTFTISATNGGDEVELTDDGSGTHSVQMQDETSYYPTAFERQIFEWQITGDQFPLRSEFLAQLGFEVMLLRPERRQRTRGTVAKWVFRILVGSYESVNSPAGINLSNPVWDANPLVEVPMIITESPVVHTIGLQIQRAVENSLEKLSLNKLLYGNKSGGRAPSSVPFALRGEFARFDIEDGISDPRGFIAFIGPDKFPEGGEELSPLGFGMVQ